MKEYLSYREQILLNYIKNYYLKTTEVKFVLPLALRELTPFKDFLEVVNTAMALEIRNYVTLDTLDKQRFYGVEITLTEKALNAFNSPIEY